MITALRPGRTIALVQRKRRRMHVASISNGDRNWITICDLDVAADSAAFWSWDAEQAVEEHADQLCAHCHRMILMAAYLVQVGATRTRKVATR